MIRIDKGSERNQIFNIDFPDVMAAREQLAGVDPRETNICMDLTDHRWMEQIDATAGYDMKTPGVRGIHRFLARAGDDLMKMQIVRVEMAGKPEK